MECNRDEAIRAKDIAEKKFAIQDFPGAKKFFLKAQQLYPALEGVPQWLAVLDVHIMAQMKAGSNSNETDWYGILQVLVLFMHLFFLTTSRHYRISSFKHILLDQLSDGRSSMHQSTTGAFILIAF